MASKRDPAARSIADEASDYLAQQDAEDHDPWLPWRTVALWTVAIAGVLLGLWTISLLMFGW